ncbi:hypothetical protein CR513_30026, partial [Mucuna pruriens]
SLRGKTLSRERAEEEEPLEETPKNKNNNPKKPCSLYLRFSRRQKREEREGEKEKERKKSGRPVRFLQVRRIYIRCIVASLHVPYCFFPIGVVLELYGLKGVLLSKIIEDNTNRMVSLNGTNYHSWKGKIKDLLFVKKMHLPVFAAQKPESIFIQLFVDNNVYNHIASEIHARTLWGKIESLYASKCGNNKLFLLNSIVSLKFKGGTSISDHLNEFQGIID